MMRVELLIVAVATFGSGFAIVNVELPVESPSGMSATSPALVNDNAEPELQLPLTPTPRLTVPKVGPGAGLAEGDDVEEPLEPDPLAVGDALAFPVEVLCVLGKAMLMAPGELLPASPRGGSVDDPPPLPPQATRDAAIATRTIPNGKTLLEIFTACAPLIADSNWRR